MSLAIRVTVIEVAAIVERWRIQLATAGYRDG